MHIPRSGGTSVHVALEQALPAGTISPKRQETLAGALGESSDPEIRATFVAGDDEIASLSDHPVVSGHFSVTTLLRFTSASAVATVLREPRARVLSFYAFWRLLSPADRDAWRPFAPVDCALRPLAEFLTEPLAAPATDNLMCRMLLGYYPGIPEVGFIPMSDIHKVAQDAIAAAETLGYVGVLELGDSMWDGLSGFFGVPLAPTRLNTTESHTETADAPAAHDVVTLDTLDALDARTAADAIVYRHVLLSSGYSAEYVERLEATAFATELARISNLIGTSATEARILARQLVAKDEELERAAQQLVAKDEELDAVAALVQQERQQLAETNEQLGWYRLWLEGIQRSASWRLTAPLRAGKRTIMRPRSSAARLIRR